MIDHNGNLLNQITYNSKGEIVNQTSPTVSFRFAYTGREFDISTGLYYNRARYYDPITGRFISQDPIGFDSGDVNLYRYVGNSPTNFTDRSGLFFDGLLASLITTVVITVIRGVITGNWEFSFGATFTDDGDVSLNFGSGPFNTGPIPLRTTSDFSNITLRSAADLGSTLNVSPIELSTTFIPTTFDTRNLDLNFSLGSRFDSGVLVGQIASYTPIDLGLSPQFARGN